MQALMEAKGVYFRLIQHTFFWGLGLAVFGFECCRKQDS